MLGVLRLFSILELLLTLLGSSGITRLCTDGMRGCSFVFASMPMTMNWLAWRLFIYLWKYWTPFSEMFANWIWYSTSTRCEITQLYSMLIQVYAILDEVFLAGEIEETSKEKVLMRLEHLDKLE
jgi:Clathrin adaptor complex small chain